MSDMYAIKATTLTALGDAVRTKLNGTSEVPANLTGANIPIYYRNVANIDFDNNIKKTKIIGSVTWYNASGTYCDVYIVPGIYARPSRIPDTVLAEKILVAAGGVTDPYSFELLLDGSDFTFFTYPDTNDERNIAYLTYTAIPLDADGHEYKYTPLEMVEMVNNEMVVVPEIVLTGDCTNAFNNEISNKLENLIKDKITTSDVTSAQYMFNATAWTEIPFSINFKMGETYWLFSLEEAFGGSTIQSSRLIRLPKVTGYVKNMNRLCWNASSLEEIPEEFYADIDWTLMDESGYPCSQGFQFCRNLLDIPFEVMNHGRPNIYYTEAPWYNSFYSCYSLRKLKLPVFMTDAWTSNSFSSNTFVMNYALKKLVFYRPDSMPAIMKWKNQTIDLSQYIGYGGQPGNSAFTSNTQIIDDVTYQALKDDDFAWTTDVNYSRYNRNSAVTTIESLPDTSAYLATAGGTNTIKFTGAAGALTDGGAINTMTEEEIAVATAKGWTVTFV